MERHRSEVLPLTHVVTLLQGLRFGDPLTGHLTEIVVLVAMLNVGVVIAVRMYRWE